MPGGMRSRFLLSFWLALFAAACLPVHAQTNGAPPSVTSMGFGGRPINGVSPSVTSAGPNGYGSGSSFLGNCCANFFLPTYPNPSLSSRHRQHRKNNNKDKRRDHADLVGVIEPAYLPYAEPNAQENAQEADDDPPDADYVHAPGARAPSAKRAEDSEAASAEPEDQVAAQPSTVLIFKDGHQSGVLNYAIVGDTLFDFESGRTRKILLADLDLPATQKANDDLGVDFKLPSGSK